MKQREDTKQEFSTRRARVIGYGAIFLMLGGFVAWAGLSEIDGAVVAPGRLIVDKNRQAIEHPHGGVVERVVVQEGDTVSADSLLVQFDPTLTQSELTIVEGQLFELMARRGRLEAEQEDASTLVFDPLLLERARTDPNVAKLVEGQRRLFQARLESFEKSIIQLTSQREQLRLQIVGIDAQSAALDQQVHLVSAETTSQETLLQKGLAQSVRVMELRRETARLDGQRGEMVSRRAEAQTRIAEIATEELQLQSQRREQAISMLRDLQFNEMEMAERRRTLLTQLERMNVRAPISGIVYDFRILGERSVVKPADPMMFIIPQDRPLIIEAEINPIDVNKVFVNQEVVLNFTAFDMRSTPALMGRVLRVSPDSFVDATSQRTYYRAEIELPPSEAAKLDVNQVLVPGMPVEAFIRTGLHTPLAYLTTPLTRFFRKAFRDEA